MYLDAMHAIFNNVCWHDKVRGERNDQDDGSTMYNSNTEEEIQAAITKATELLGYSALRPRQTKVVEHFLSFVSPAQETFHFRYFSSL